MLAGVLTSSHYASASKVQTITKANATKCKWCQSSGGPETPQSKNYASSGVNFGENSFGGPLQLNRDTPDDALKKIASQMSSQNTGNVIIPSWVYKANRYYSEGSISYDDFFKEIKYLVKVGIIKVS